MTSTTWYLNVDRWQHRYESSLWLSDCVALDLAKVPEKHRADVVYILARGQSPYGFYLGWWDRKGPFSSWVDITDALIHHVKIPTSDEYGHQLSVGEVQQKLIDCREHFPWDPDSYPSAPIRMLYAAQSAIAVAGGLNDLDDDQPSQVAAEHLERAGDLLDVVAEYITAVQAAADQKDQAALRRALEHVAQIEASTSASEPQFALYDANNAGEPGRRVHRRWWLR